MRGNLVALAAILFAGVIAAVFLLRAVETVDTARFDAEVSELAVPHDWKRITDTVRPAQYPCLSANPCPSIFQRRTANEQVTGTTLAAIAKPAGLDLAFNSPCQRHPENSGDDPLCTACATKNGHRYIFNVVLREGAEYPDLVVEVRPIVNG